MNLQELKGKEPQELLKQADKLGIENPSSLRKQDLMFAILKTIAEAVSYTHLTLPTKA